MDDQRHRNQERHRADRGDLTFRVRTGSGTHAFDEPTIVLHQGEGMSHRYLTRLHDALSSAARVVSTDLLGVGGPPKPRTDVSVPRMAGALADVVASLGLGRVVLIGHPMVAQWAVEMTTRRRSALRHSAPRAVAAAIVAHLGRRWPIATASHVCQPSAA